MSISMLFEQINDIKQLFSETSKQLENEKLKTEQIREAIATTERDSKNYSALNSELSSEIARTERITQERLFSVEFNQRKKESLLQRCNDLKEEVRSIQTKREADRLQFEKRVEEFNVDIEDDPNVVEQRIERTIVNVEGELLRSKKKLDALKDSVSTKKKKCDELNSTTNLKNSMQASQIEKQNHLEALKALERQTNELNKQADTMNRPRLAEALESKKDLSDYCTALKRQLDDVRLTKKQLLSQLELKKVACASQMPKDREKQFEPTQNEQEADDASIYDEFFAATQVK